jgi:hypothetical protein
VTVRELSTTEARRTDHEGPVTPARTRRTVAAVVTVWLFGLLLVLGMWQQVDAACDGADTTAADAACAPLPGPADAPSP